MDALAEDCHMRVRATEASFDINGARLVGPVSVDADPGGHLAIVGPNGAGKSTLLRLLAGEVRPTAGSIAYDDVATTELSVSDLAKRRAVLGQHQTEEVAFTVHQVVTMGRYAHRGDPSIGRADDQNSVGAALDAVDLRGLGNRRVSSLSGGERQRTALARVLAQETPVLLLDEPTTALDILHQQMVIEIIATLADRGRTVVAVLHDLNLATSFDRVLLLSEGTPSAYGSAEEVLTSTRLSQVYHYPIEVIDHPLHAGRLILPRPGH
jgi:iron complex transport system ATP-binding protein